MADYRLEFTDVNVPIVTVQEKEEIYDLVDITLFGFTRLRYGRDLNENFVHLLENFAAPEKGTDPGNPDLSQIITIDTDETNGFPLLFPGRPIEGQVWYNKTASETGSRPYVFYDDEWHPLEVLGREVAANWGQIADGEQIPQPVSESGYVFSYDECSWIVSPFNQLDVLDEMECRTDNLANVTMEYLYSGDASRTSGVANYLIVGLKDNNNIGVTLTPDPVPSPTPTPTPTSSPGSSPLPTPTPTPTVTPSNTPDAGAPLSITADDPYTAQCVTSSLQCTASTGILQGISYTVSGGTSPYTFVWEYISGASFNISNSTTSSPTLSRSRTVEQLNVTGFGRVTVTDNVGDTAQTDFTFITDHYEMSTTPSATPDPTPDSTPDPTPDSTPDPTPAESPPAPLSASETDSDCDIAPFPIYNDTDCSGGSLNIVDAFSVAPEQNLTITGGVAPYSYEIVAGTASWNPTKEIGIASTSVNANTPSDGIISVSYTSQETTDVVELEGTVTSTVRVTDAEGSTTTVSGVTCSVDIFRTCNDIQ